MPLLQLDSAFWFKFLSNLAGTKFWLVTTLLPSTITCWGWLLRKSCIQRSVDPRMPRYSDFRRRRLWGTVSKAFEKSSRIRSVWSFSSNPIAKSLMVNMSCVSQDLRFLKPCCKSVRSWWLDKCLTTVQWMTCSQSLQRMAVSEIGR